MADGSEAGPALERVLLIHERYREPGGEDAVFEAEADLLEQHGHRVERLVEDNRSIPERPSPARSLGLAATTVWSPAAARRVHRLVRRFRPDVVHVHNTFPLLSPAILPAARSAGAAVVQTLHNYRLICPAATLLRDGRPCQDCVGRPPLPGVIHACYRGSHAQSAVLAAMLVTHRVRGTWHHDVDVYIALSEFARGRFVAGGLPAERIAVKPNFVAGDGLGHQDREGHLLFVGRLSPEKGVDMLTRAWSRLPADATLRVVGAGPMEASVRELAARHPGVRLEGWLDRAAVRTEMSRALALVFPSIWYECFPMTIVEAFAAGLPVICGRLGAMAELIEDGRTGLLYEPGEPADLARVVAWACAHPGEMALMGEAARRTYEECYTPERNYGLLRGLYARALTNRADVMVA